VERNVAAQTLLMAVIQHSYKKKHLILQHPYITYFMYIEREEKETNGSLLLTYSSVIKIFNYIYTKKLVSI
jgi:hypothetical protein